ncbi:MAG TPA: HEAT repeat domain-containing protein [Acidimicrobiales bacterium]|nr:HEAT repeat domain-containing protein [Acidimicrobiales bacterium]
MGDDPATHGRLGLVDVVAAGHRGDASTARRALGSVDPRVREVALGALARTGDLDVATVERALRDDPDPAVRRRACDLAASLQPSGPLLDGLLAALGDPDALVVEAACWALGESSSAPVDALGRTARSHPDARAREAALAAIGSIGDPRGLPAVLAALDDRPTVRRRAVVALAAFDGEEVRAALRRAAADRDWQVREVAEILLEEEPDDAEDEEAEPE